MASITVRSLTPTIGAELGGVDLREPLDDATITAIRRALLDHLVIFLREQELTPAEQLRFSEYFGPVMVSIIDTKSTEVPGVTVLDQTAPKGEFTDRWHTDHTFVAEPPLGSVLRAVQLPSSGGDTCFASMYAAYDALSSSMQHFLDGLTAVHSTKIVMRGTRHLTNVIYRDADDPMPAVVHPVVRVHPETGRKLLFVCSNFTTRICELTEPESDALLALLFEHIKDPLFQCRFHWEPASLAFWDNRAAQHCAIPDYTERRLMYRTMIGGGGRPLGPYDTISTPLKEVAR